MVFIARFLLRAHVITALLRLEVFETGTELPSAFQSSQLSNEKLDRWLVVVSVDSDSET